MDRRNLITGLFLACLVQAVAPAYADGGSGSGSGGSGSGSSGSGSGGSGSGSGSSGNSGSGNSGSGSSNSGGDDNDDDDDDDWAKAADSAQRGEISSLPVILKLALANAPGKVIGVKLQHRNSNYVYRVKILTTTGRKVELAIDARSKALKRI